MAKTENLKPWPKGVSGNPGGRPKTKPLTEEIERLLEQEASGAKGKTIATKVAEALVKKACKGDLRAIAELINRVEGKPLQPVNVSGNVNEGLAEAIRAARARVANFEAQHRATEAGGQDALAAAAED